MATRSSRRGRGTRWLIVVVVVLALAADVVTAVLARPGTPVSAAAGVTLTNSTLVFTPDHPVSFTVKTSQPVRWNVTDLAGARIADGSDLPATNAFVVITPTDSLSEGLYRLTLTTDRGTIAANFMVVGAAPADDPYYGAATHHRDPSTSLPLMESLGIDMGRAEANWASFEDQQGVVKTPPEISDWIKGAAQVDSRAIWVAGYGNPLYQNGQHPVTETSAVEGFTNYINKFLDENPEVRYVEVYNEFNSQAFNNSGCRTGTCYAALLKAVYTAVKPDHENVTIIGGGYGGYNAGWFGDMFAAGGWKYADAFSYHPYAMTPAKILATVDSLNAMQRQYGSGGLKPVYFTEVGWSSVKSSAQLSGLRVDSESEQAYRMVADFVAPQARANVAGVAWYDLINDAKGGPSGTQSNFGLFSASTSTIAAAQPKEAAWAFYLLRQRLDGFKFQGSSTTDDVMNYTFENSSGQTEHVLFRSDLSQIAATSNATHQVAVSGLSGGEVVATDALGRPVAVSRASGGITVGVGDAPVYIRGS